MAQSTGQEKSAGEIRQQIAHSRDRLASDLDAFRYEMDFPLKFRKSFQRKTGLWVASSAVLGVVLSALPARTKVVKIRAGKHETESEKVLGAGLALTAMKVVGSLLKPVVANFIATKLKAGSFRPSSKQNW